MCLALPGNRETMQEEDRIGFKAGLLNGITSPNAEPHGSSGLQLICVLMPITVSKK